MTTPASEPRPKKRGMLLGLLVLLLVLVAYRVREGAGAGGVAALVKPARTVAIAPSQDLEIKAGAIQRWQWDVTPEQPTCRITGHIQVTNGGARDVQVYILTADDYANLVNGHQARAFFQTEKTTAVTLDVRTAAPGPKVLAISNAFSVLTSKTVELRGIQALCQ